MLVAFCCITSGIARFGMSFAMLHVSSSVKSIGVSDFVVLYQASQGMTDKCNYCLRAVLCHSEVDNVSSLIV